MEKVLAALNTEKKQVIDALQKEKMTVEGMRTLPYP
jgi:hypothetical protein